MHFRCSRLEFNPDSNVVAGAAKVVTGGWLPMTMTMIPTRPPPGLSEASSVWTGSQGGPAPPLQSC
jgi:hypothetical protein